MFSLLKTSCNYLPCIVYYAQKYITQGGHTQYKMIKAWTLDTMICIHSRKECCILGNWSPRQKLKLLITRQHFAFLWRTYRSSSPRSEPGSLILSSFQQHNKITDKTVSWPCLTHSTAYWTGPNCWLPSVSSKYDIYYTGSWVALMTNNTNVVLVHESCIFLFWWQFLFSWKEYL